MRYGHHEFDMSHALAAYFLLSHFHTATLAHDTFIADTFIFTAMALIVLGRAKNALAEQTIALRFIGTIVDCFRFEHFAGRDLHNLIGRRQTNRDLGETGTFSFLFKSHNSPPILFHVDTECETMQFMQEHIERFGQTRCGEVLSFDDSLVCACASCNIV